MLGPTDNNVISNRSSKNSQRHWYSLSSIIQMLMLFISMLAVYLSTQFYHKKEKW
jgi:hypothetical protein